jgi:hypothetical protein
MLAVQNDSIAFFNNDLIFESAHCSNPDYFQSHSLTNTFLCFSMTIFKDEVGRKVLYEVGGF